MEIYGRKLLALHRIHVWHGRPVADKLVLSNFVLLILALIVTVFAQ